MFTQSVCAAEGREPAESVYASASSLQAEVWDNGTNSANQVPRLATSAKQKRQVPTVKLSIIMAAYNEQDTIELAVNGMTYEFGHRY